MPNHAMPNHALPNHALKSFACGDVVPGCSRSFRGSDDADILAQVAAHAGTDHGLVDIPPHVIDAVRAHIHPVNA